MTLFALPDAFEDSMASLYVEEPIVIYLLMRDELTSMNTGKACAQSHHAGTQMALKDCLSWEPLHREWLVRWASEASGFGTVLCLGVSESTMNKALDIAARLGVPNAVVHDPAYPLIDGSVLHLLPLDTCAYIFGPKVLIANATAGLDLHA
jgi:peptidyl-tRNA hydrolase